MNKASSRTNDPSSSKEAARNIEDSGLAETLRQRCLSVVRKFPGWTSAEIADYLRSDRYTPSRRLPELRKAGLVHNRETRKCRIRNTNQMTWYPGDGLVGQRTMFPDQSNSSMSVEEYNRMRRDR